MVSKQRLFLELSGRILKVLSLIPLSDSIKLLNLVSAFEFDAGAFAKLDGAVWAKLGFGPASQKAPAITVNTEGAYNINAGGTVSINAGGALNVSAAGAIGLLAGGVRCFIWCIKYYSC